MVLRQEIAHFLAYRAPGNLSAARHQASSDVRGMWHWPASDRAGCAGIHMWSQLESSGISLRNLLWLRGYVATMATSDGAKRGTAEHRTVCILITA